MKKEILKKTILIFLIASFFVSIFMSPLYAQYNTNELFNEAVGVKLNSDGGNQLLTKYADLINAVATLASVAAIGVAMVVGIKYILGSSQDKAIEKKSIFNYLMAASLAFGTIAIVNMLIKVTDKGVFKNFDVANVGGSILYVISMIGSFVAMGVLIYIAIKYILGSAEDKSDYKKNLTPYILGCIILFAAPKIAEILYTVFSKL